MKAKVISDWFIAHNHAVMKYNSADEISNLKMQKLLYYAQGCALISLGERLFEDDIIAWKHGPVVEEEYRRFSAYGSRGIDEMPEYPVFEPMIENLLINTYNHFAKYSAWELANLTHKEDPWRLTQINHVISLILIKNYFASHYSDVMMPDKMTENIELLRQFGTFPENWDGEDAAPFDSNYIRNMIDLVSTLQVQPDVGPTGRGSIDLVYGSLKDGNTFLNFEIFQDDRRVHLVSKDILGNVLSEDIDMEDVNGRIRQF